MSGRRHGGTSEAMFFATVMPRIGFALPARSMLEIAPGFGRCTNILLRFVMTYCGVDLSEACVKSCQERFAGHPNTVFYVNDGKSLDVVGNASFDFIFSYDSLVHADMDAIEPYVRQIVSRLTPDGVAFIHHSNLAAVPPAEYENHEKPFVASGYGNRSKDVSGAAVVALIEDSGGRVLVQEIYGPAPGFSSDCFSTFCRVGAHQNFERQLLHNRVLLSREGALAKEVFQHYQRIGES